MRVSATASAGSWATASRRPASAASVRACRSPARSSGAQSASRPPTIQNASWRSARGWRARTRRGWRVRAPASGSLLAAERAHEHGDPLAPAAQPGGALVALLGGRRAHLRVDVREQRRAAVAAAREEAERLVEPAAVEVRIEVVEARRQAAAHLAVRGRPRAQPQRAAAVAQPEQRVELLLELDGAGAAAQRADRDRAAGGRLARDLEHGIGDVEPAAQVDVRVVVLVDLVARRAQRADEAVLEHERAELRARPAMVDDRRLVGPDLGRRRRREVRARAGAQRDRLADVEDLAGGVAKEVDAGRVGQRGGVGLVALDRAARRACGPPAAAGCGAAATAPRARRRRSRRARTAARTARRTRARRSRRRRARGASSRPRSRARRRAPRAGAGARAARSGARARPCRGRADRATAARRARTPGAARGDRRPRCARRARARATGRRGPAARRRPAAPRRPSAGRSA